MQLIELIPVGYRVFALVLALMLLAGLSAASAWKVQDWRYGQQLAKKNEAVANQHSEALQMVVGELEQQKAERNALEVRLKTNDEAHHKELTDAQDAQKRLRDRIATADVRLSVLLASGYQSNGGGQVPAATATGGVVYGSARAELEPAHAQRIIGITDDGDAGLIALAACQAYAKEVSTQK
ncbi:lysis system i-spanin subunit Rz [Pseudomonas fluorescens]|uniref:lysis system i-spanin subunit Rz n=1 Tax=Pseudomonas fluorescens TaxID=294 RepID=UPI001241C898|nr:lysis system i-spanin subunit Rz [Pseudomonas fluorescens]VVN44992.1 hypothetical protein PS639_05665 [Pseudomonas fluorescens]